MEAANKRLREEMMCFIISPIKILWDSLKIIYTHKFLFFSIFILTTLPLSFLTFTFAISTHTRILHIHHLEAVARVSHTRVEARHVLDESRLEAVSLLRIRALFALLSFPLSLAAAVASVHTTTSVSSSAVFSVVKDSKNWKRPAVTVIFVYCILLAFAPVPRVISAAFGSNRVISLLLGSGIQIYLFAALSIGFVVSVIEDRVGWDAIRVGSSLMNGKRFCGWVLSGLFVLVSGFINDKVEALLEKNRNNLEIEIRVWDKRVLVLICSYAVVVLASYVVTTVFYFDSRRRLDIKEQQQHQDEGQHCVEVSSSL